MIFSSMVLGLGKRLPLFLNVPGLPAAVQPPAVLYGKRLELDVIAEYLRSYTTALKDKPSQKRRFRKAYIDAFAGTGYRDARRDDIEDDPQQMSIFPDLAEVEPQEFLDGSARLALKVEPGFDSYVFIERGDALRETRGTQARISTSRGGHGNPPRRRE